MYSKGGGTECNSAFDFHLLLVLVERNGVVVKQFSYMCCLF